MYQVTRQSGVTEGRREAKKSASPINGMTPSGNGLNYMFRFRHRKRSHPSCRYLESEASVKEGNNASSISPCHHKRIHAYMPATVMPELKSSYLLTMPDELIITFSVHHMLHCSEYEVLLPLYVLVIARGDLLLWAASQHFEGLLYIVSESSFRSGK